MNTYYLFTDGSHFKARTGSGRLGIGAVLINPDTSKQNGLEISNLSEEIDPSDFKEDYGTSDFSNPTMEIYAVLVAIRELLDDIPIQKSLIISKSDYLGVSKWLNGEWKITKPYIQKIKNEIDQEVKKRGIHIKFEWVPGHQNGNSFDATWNNVVDKLSKGEA